MTTPPWQVVTLGQRPSIPIPLVIKPSRQGSTVGVYIVKNAREVDAAMAEAAKYDEKLLVEKFISGRELTIGILGDQVLPILEIIPKGGFYDFTNKYPFLNPQAGGGAEHVCPAKIDPEKTRQIQDLALRAYRALGCCRKPPRLRESIMRGFACELFSFREPEWGAGLGDIC